MSQVFVLGTTQRPLNPVHTGHARLLLKQGKAAVYRRYPFTVILKRAVEHPCLELLRVKFDPGSQTTGLAVVNDASVAVVWAAELTHRGKQIKRALESRRAVQKESQATQDQLPQATLRRPLRTSGSFNLTTRHRTVQGISHHFCTLIARSDGYSYQQGKERVLPPVA